MYYDEDTTEKYQDPITGAHFDFIDICNRLDKVKETRMKSEEPSTHISEHDFSSLIKAADFKQSRNVIKHAQTENQENMNSNINYNPNANIKHNRNSFQVNLNLNDMRRALQPKQ
jgi:hypothetical protein